MMMMTKLLPTLSQLAQHSVFTVSEREECTNIYFNISVYSSNNSSNFHPFVTVTSSSLPKGGPSAKV